MQFVSRSAWGARAPKSVTRLATAKGVKIHYTGSVATDVPVDKCSTQCRDKVRAIQRHHMDSNGWADIAYNLLVCQHGVVWEGRGARVMSAANGPGLNSGHYAVCALIGNKGLTEPTEELLHGLRDAVEYLQKHGAGPEIKGHRDGYSTDCPGGPLYAWVEKGAPRPKSGASAKPAPPESMTWTEKAVKSLPEIAPAEAGAEPLKSWDVKTVFHLLAARGYPVGAGVDDTVYSAAVVERVKAFQKAAGITVDGIVGKVTWTKLLRL